MEQTFQIEHSGETFRIKKMNAIEILAVRSQISNKDVATSMNMFSTILECIECRVGNEWLPVKTKGKEVYFPNGIEDDVLVIQDLVSYFMGEFLVKVFQKSNA